MTRIHRGPRQKVLRALHLFSGPEREGDVSWWFKVKAAQRGYSVFTENVDNILNKEWDLGITTFFVWILELAGRGLFHFLVGGTPCST